MLINCGWKWLALLALFLAASTAGAQTQFPLGGNGWMGLGNRNGDFFIVQDDLQVKVPGGYVRINRDYDGKQWVFNRQWSGLGRPSYNKAMYPSIGAFFSCTVVDGVSSCDTTASSGSSIQFANPENDVQQTRIPNDPFFGRNADGSPAPDPYLDQFVARMGVGFTRSSDGTSWVSSKHPRFVLRPQQVPALPVSGGPDAHPASGRPGKGGVTTVQVNGFRWTDRSGSWIEYDNLGRITSYGDRNDVRVWMQYGAHGQVERVLDDNGRTVFTLLYSNGSADFITEVRDHTPVDGSIRRVKYHYDGDGRLRNVIDARGNPTAFDYGSLDSVAYDYNGSYGASGSGGSGEPINARASSNAASLIVDTRRKVTKVTDAEGRVTEIGYGVTARVGRIKGPDGGLTEFDYGYDKLKKEFSVTVRHPQTDAGRRIETRYYDQEGRVARREVNGKVLMTAQGSRQSMSYIDELNNTIRVDRNNFDEVTRRTNADGSSVSIAYDSVWLDPREVVDEAGNATRMEYDAKGNLARFTSAAETEAEQVTEYGSSSRGEPTLVRRVGGARSDGPGDADVELHFNYDANGNIETYVDGEGKVWRYEYDALGNMTKATNPLGHAWRYTYDDQSNRLTATDPNGAKTSFAYDKTGRLKNVRDAGERVYQIEYDPAGRPQRMIDPMGAVASLEYDQAGQLVANSDAMNQRVSLSYDSFGRVASVTDNEGNATSFGYGDVDGVDRGSDLVTTVNYPTLQRLLKYNSTQDLTTSIDVVGDEQRATSATYDPRGLLKSRVNPYGKTQSNEHDTLGRPIVATDELGAQVKFGYDRRNNLSSVTDELGNVTRMEYDGRDLLVKEVTAEGEATLFEHDDAGRLSKVSRANGFRVEFIYDAGGRVVERRSIKPDGSLELADSFNWDAASRLISWTSGSATRTATFDDRNRLLSETVTVDGVAMTHQYTYHANGKVRTFTGPSGATVTHSYDRAGNLQRLDIPGEGSISVTQRRWTQPEKVVLPGGSVQEIEHDPILNPTRLRVRNPAQAIVFEQSSEYGKLDEVRARTTQGKRVEFVYDDALRLVQADASGFGSLAEQYELDAADNRMGDNLVAGPWEYDRENRLARRGLVSYQYDPAGNLIAKIDSSQGEPRRTTRYAYDGYNRLVEVSNGADEVLARYSYDPFGYRLSKEVTAAGASSSGAPVGKRLFLQAEQGLLAEVATDGRVIQEYGWHPALPYGTSPLFVRANSSYFYYQNDGLGQPRQLLDKNGSVVWEATIASPFGWVTGTTGSAVEQPWRLPGQYYDVETGFHYNLHRYYAPEIGRYITADPFGLWAGPNFYAYVQARPTMLVDPLGLIGRGLPRIGPPTLRDGDDTLVGPQPQYLPRPTSQDFWDSYLNYDDYVLPGDVWDTIGGPLGKFGVERGRGNAEESCAARVSHGLNEAGTPMSSAYGTIGGRGGNGKGYVISAEQLRLYLGTAWGPPDASLKNYDDFSKFWNTLETGQVAIVVSDRHAAVMKRMNDPVYTDPHLHRYYGDAWKLPMKRCDDCE